MPGKRWASTGAPLRGASGGSGSASGPIACRASARISPGRAVGDAQRLDGDVAAGRGARAPSRQSAKPLSRNSRWAVSPARVTDALAARGCSVRRSAPTAPAATGPGPRRRTGGRTAASRPRRSWCARSRMADVVQVQHRQVVLGAQAVDAGLAADVLVVVASSSLAVARRRTPSGRSLSTVRWPGLCWSPIAVQCISGDGASSRPVARPLSCSRAPPARRALAALARLAVSTAATRSVMMRWASITSCSRSGISAPSRSSAAGAPGRSAAPPTARRPRARRACPGSACARRSSSCSSAGWLFTRRHRRRGVVDDAARSQGIAARSSRSAQLGKVTTAHPVHAQRRQHLADVRRQRRPVGHHQHAAGGKSARVGVGQVGHAVQADGGLAAARAALDHRPRPLPGAVISSNWRGSISAAISGRWRSSALAPAGRVAQHAARRGRGGVAVPGRPPARARARRCAATADCLSPSRGSRRPAGRRRAAARRPRWSPCGGPGPPPRPRARRSAPRSRCPRRSGRRAG